MPDLVEILNAPGPVAKLRLNRPEKKNAVTLEMLEALVAACARLADQPGLRAVVLSGAGGDFSAGMDTAVLMGFAGNLDAVKAEMLAGDGDANRFQAPAKALHDLPVPVIAAIEGVCFGAGMQLALAADFRIAAPGAQLSIMEAKWGLIPDMGISLSLPKLMPADRAKALIMTARVMTGDDALAEGLVTRLADAPHAAAIGFAETLAGQSPDAVRAAKTLVDALWANRTAEGLRLEAELQAALMGAPNQVETVMARIQGRAPDYG
ncbi:crotonase/enoyl-CoA hydratase family protein [Rhodobacteraceae bacterium W635]|uniref:crotonase/enoyl-CoA hydratase family protein n=1 Tax=Nioella halotolerans TaxID=2303578 RepID=UPI000E3E2933|nr:crotonase/enoyl-CoA hydratase family protein [Rhodobacteraceae bacterium W635]